MLFNQILNPRLTSPLVRLFGMKTPSNPAPTLAPEIQPVVDVNQYDDPAAFFLRRSRLVGARSTVAAVAAQNGEFQLRNPADSGVLLIVRTLHVSSASSVSWATRITTVDYASVLTVGWNADTRWLTSGGSGVRTGVLSSQTTAVPLFWSGGTIYPNDTAGRIINAVIAPGTAFVALVDTANVSASFTLQWEERSVDAAELQQG